MNADLATLEALIRAGIDHGQFDVADPAVPDCRKCSRSSNPTTR